MGRVTVSKSINQFSKGPHVFVFPVSSSPRTMERGGEGYSGAIRASPKSEQRGTSRGSKDEDPQPPVTFTHTPPFSNSWPPSFTYIICCGLRVTSSALCAFLSWKPSDKSEWEASLLSRWYMLLALNCAPLLPGEGCPHT